MVSFVVVTFTRSAWLALAVQATLFTLLLARDRELHIRWPAPKRVMAIALAAAILVASAVTFAVLGRQGMATAWERVAEVWRAFGAQGAPLEPGAHGVPPTTVQHRRAIWVNTLAMARSAPLHGVGLGNYPVVYPAFARPSTPGRGLGARAPLDFAYNDYLQALAELGLVGGGLFAWLLLAAWRTLRRTWLREPLADRRALVLGVAVGLAGLGVEAAFSFPWRQALPPLVTMVYLGVLAALVTRFGWDAGAWRLLDTTVGRRRIVPGVVAAAACGVLALTVWLHGRWLRADRHVWRMVRAEEQGARETAVAEARAAHRLDPARPEPLLTMGREFLAAGGPHEALPPLDELIEAWPHDADTRYLRGAVLERLGRLAEAREEYRRARELLDKRD
jgi:tetratricopeptide (TPR) repeat protein